MSQQIAKFNQLVSMAFIATVIFGTAARLSPSNQMYCVLPQNGTQPCQPPCEACHHLSYYASHINQYFTSDTTIMFLAGVHLLGDNTSILINNVSQTEIVGANYNTTIECESEGSGGFMFVNSTNIKIKNLTFLNCGQDTSAICDASCRAAIAFDTITMLFIYGITVNYSSGWGVYTKRLFGCSSVVNSTFASNSGTPEYDGGNIAFNYTNCSADTSATLSLSSLKILYGYSSHANPAAPGLFIFLECTNVNISISNVKMVGNRAISPNVSTGGNIAIIYRNYTNLVVNFVTVQDCYIVNGSAYQGAGMFVSIFEASPASVYPANISQTIAQSLHVSNTHFIGNHAWSLGGLFIILHEMSYIYGITGELIFENCTFSYNTLSTGGNWVGGTAVHIKNNNVPEYIPHGIPQFSVSFIDCKFSHNSLNSTKNCSGSATVFVIKKLSGTHFINCTFEDNGCSALSAVQSILVFRGNITVQGNNGTDGGGLILCDRSYIYLNPHTNITLDSNHAWHSGGGIYADDECLETIPLCFFQLDEEIILNISLLSTVHIKMINNTAAYAGSALYGGSVDYCYIPGVGSHLLLKPSGPQIFKEIFEFQRNTDLSYIIFQSYWYLFLST